MSGTVRAQVLATPRTLEARARELGADAAIDAEAGDVVDQVRAATAGGAAVVVDTTHVPGVNPIHLAIVPGAPRVPVER
jgi:NADPH:quinone reductase-like Zn-dependent oxidoreductase